MMQSVPAYSVNLHDYVCQLCSRFVSDNGLPLDTVNQLQYTVVNAFQTNFIFKIEQLALFSIDDMQRIGIPFAFAMYLQNAINAQQQSSSQGQPYTPYSPQQVQQQPVPMDRELKEHQKQNVQMQQYTPPVQTQVFTTSQPMFVTAPEPVITTTTTTVVADATPAPPVKDIGGSYVSTGFVLCIVGIFFPFFLWLGTFVFFLGCFNMCSSIPIARANGTKCFIGFIISGIFTGLEIAGIIGGAVAGGGGGASA